MRLQGTDLNHEVNLFLINQNQTFSLTDDSRINFDLSKKKENPQINIFCHLLK